MSDITVRLTPEGATELVNALKQVQRQLGDVGREADEAKRKTSGLSRDTERLIDSVGRSDRSFGRLGKSIGLTGTGMVFASGAMQSLTGESSKSAQAMGQLALKAGAVLQAVGTQGLAGGLSALAGLLLPTLVDALTGASAAQEKMKKAAEDATAALKQEREAAEDLRAAIRGLSDLELERRGREVGGGRSAEASFVPSLPAGTTLGGLAGTVRTGALTGEEAQLFVEQQRRGQEERAQAREDERERISRRAERRSGGGGRRFVEKVAGDKFTPGHDDATAHLGVRASTRVEQSLETRLGLAAKAAAEQPGTLANTAAGLDRAVLSLDRMADGLERIRKMNDPFERMKKGAIEAGEAIVDNIGDAATSALRSNVEAWVSGEQTIGQAAAGIVKSVVKAILVESLVKTVFETAEGIASLARYDFPGAAQHFAAAATYGAVAGVAGAAGAAIGAVGGGGGAATGTAAQPARPERPARGRDEQGGGTTVINVYALEPSAETGRRIVKSIDRARRAQLVPAGAI